VTRYFLGLVSRLYGSAALARRRWYASHPSARRRLARPVVSIGNLSVGGAGKTPLVVAVARLLLEMGERPSILSRGYGRRCAGEGVVVVSDALTRRASVSEAGDEPFMLATALPGAAVLVCEDRYKAGRLAETQFGCTVHVLDDGFQHFGLERDVDLLVVGGDDLDHPDPLPLGRLREPLAAAAAADAVLASSMPGETARSLRVPCGFSVRRAIGRPRTSPTGARGGETPVAPPGPVLALAGIARPQRFFDDLRAAGWTLAGTRTFPDHHWFSARDVAAVEDAARAAGAQAILTTEKDMVRLANPDGARIPFLWVPLDSTPDEAFAPWLRERLEQARLEHATP